MPKRELIIITYSKQLTEKKNNRKNAKMRNTPRELVIITYPKQLTEKKNNRKMPKREAPSESLSS